MKIFALAINNKEISFSGDLTLGEVKEVIETIMRQQAFEQGRQVEKQRIRQGYKAKRGREL